MDKLERAKVLVAQRAESCRAMLFHGEAEAMAHALRILEAVEGVEEWMVEWLTAPDTDQAWEHVPEDLTVKVGEEPRWTRVDARIADTLQAILDAKGGG